MIVGLVQCECIVYIARSLKDKRAVILSILRKATNGRNLAASETGHQDAWQRTALAFVSVGTSKVHVEQELARALSLIDVRADIERTETFFEWF
ncbi:DUF503 family protein [Sporolactobacillus sp. THM7-4]|nr:DUF503 family protein [Sporolactobacillus sp. THM7-4]